MKYALIDTANTFFRARHVASRNSTTEEKVGMALHLTLASVNQVVKKFGIDHVAFMLEGRSFRKDLYKPYKANRIVDSQSVTEAEVEENKMFWDTYESLTQFLRERTNVSVYAIQSQRQMISSHVLYIYIQRIKFLSSVAMGTIYN